ncbi:MAG: DUF4105 domain-containing protein, partial [Bdellovibrionota bacterium]
MKRVSVLFLFVTSTLIGMRSANAIDGRLKAYAESPQWRRLLHMGGTVARSKSRIEPGSGFFISNAGPRSPLSELEATIAAFENPESYLKKGRGHPYCLFPARVKILERDLTIKIDKSVECPNLDAWNRQLDVKEIAIVYASQFVSNPASAMGHTLLKIVGKNRDDYLNVALGYAADIDEKVGGFAYMWKGLFGGFDGIFSYSPYYEKVHEYNDMEKRDLWEFTLDLDSARQRLLLDHLWELMSNADIDYFFLDENCSYLTLAALEVVFPERDFLTEFPVYLIPLESVKVLDAQGLVSSTTFRPSIQRKLKHKYGLLASDQKKALLQSIEQNSNSELTDPLSLETLLDYISVQRQTGQGTLPEELVKLELETFTKRSLAGQYSHPAIPTPDSPLRSSGTYHLELGAGENRANRNFIHLTFRPGVRQAMDVDTGYLPNSAFNFLQFELKHYG